MVGVCMCNIESPASDPSSQSSVVFIGAADLYFLLLVTCRDVITGPSSCHLLAVPRNAKRSVGRFGELVKLITLKFMSLSTESCSGHLQVQSVFCIWNSLRVAEFTELDLFERPATKLNEAFSSLTSRCITCVNIIAGRGEICAIYFPCVRSVKMISK